MVISLLLLWGGGMLLLARWICGKWLNHLSLYTVVWTLSLVAYELRLIAYDRITFEAWLYIFTAWIAIYLGTATVTLSGNRLGNISVRQRLPQLRTVIILFSLAGFASSAVLAMNMTRLIGPSFWLALTVHTNLIYPARVQGELSAIPYVEFLPYAASALAGAYAARKGRIDFVSILPLLAATVDGILTMSRAGMALSAILFIASLYLMPKSRAVSLTRRQKVGLIILSVAGFFLVSWTRGIPPTFENQGETLNRISDTLSPVPSFYMYLSVPPAGLSAYLLDPASDGHVFWGRYTFSTFYRLLSKFGFDTFVPYLQNFYYTPVPDNGCTYLRELHSDFGPLGVFVFPFVLGSVITWLEYFKTSLLRTMFLAHLYVVVLFSFSNLIMLTGLWYQSLLVSVILAAFLEKRGRAAGTALVVEPCSASN